MASSVNHSEVIRVINEFETTLSLTIHYHEMWTWCRQAQAGKRSQTESETTSQSEIESF